MIDAGYRMQDTGCRIQDAGYKILDTWNQDAGFRIPDTGFMQPTKPANPAKRDFTSNS